MKMNFRLLGALICVYGAFVYENSAHAATTPQDKIHFTDKLNKETTSALQMTFHEVNVAGLPTIGRRLMPTLAGETVTFYLGSASFLGTVDTKGRLNLPFHTTLTGTTFALRYKGLPLIALFPLAASPDGKGKLVDVHFKVTANKAGQAEVVLLDKLVRLSYDAHKGNIVGKGPITAPSTSTLNVTATNPANTATNAALNQRVTASFNEVMDSSSINTATMTLQQGATPVAGSVTYSGVTATFIPASSLVPNVAYTATITTSAKALTGDMLAVNYVWSFTTGTTSANGPAPVPLGAAGNFAILVKSGIDSVPTSAITGDLGISPAAATFITGFGLTADSSNVFSTSPQVTGKIYAADYAVPTPSNLTTSISNMETAYTDAAGRVTPDFTDLGAGDISGLTLVPGLYKWGTGVLINQNVTLSGGANDVWIFQVSQGITEANGINVILAGGALPKNIFWQSAGVVSIGTNAHFEGVILSQTSITLDTGASINGRLLAQTAVTLKSSTVTNPAP